MSYSKWNMAGTTNLNQSGSRSMQFKVTSGFKPGLNFFLQTAASVRKLLINESKCTHE